MADIPQEEANRIYTDLKANNYGSYDAFRQIIYQILNGTITDPNVVMMKRAILENLQQAVGFHVLNNPLPNGTPNPTWMQLRQEIDNFLAEMPGPTGI